MTPTILDVVQNDICVGCGACAVATLGRIPVQINEKGYFAADVSSAGAEDLARATSVCPFSNESPDEDTIAAEAFAPEMPSDDRVGRHLGMYAARITSEDEVVRSSSGGMTTWILQQLLLTGKVDGVVHVSPAEGALFEYVVSESVEDLLGGRKSRYHPASFSEALQRVRANGRRYAVVGVPCAIRAARGIARVDDVLAEQLAFFVGLVCGHMKSAAYAESFAWQLGIEPGDLETVDFRIKNPGLLSRQYSFGAKPVDGDWRTSQTIDLVGGSWGHAVFQLNACNYCDDIFAETADVVCGDAWLPKFEAEWRGTNVVLTRNREIDELIRAGSANGEVWLDELDADAVADTQAGNFRHRREGLAVRLADDDHEGRWRPRKRVAADETVVPRRRRSLVRQRRALSEASHGLYLKAKMAGDLSLYLREIVPMIERYDKVSKPSFASRLRKRLEREYWKLRRGTRRESA